MPFQIVLLYDKMLKGMPFQMPFQIEVKLFESAFGRACPSTFYHTKGQFERALKGIWWCDIRGTFTIYERAFLYGRYIWKWHFFIKGDFDDVSLSPFHFEILITSQPFIHNFLGCCEVHKHLLRSSMICQLTCIHRKKMAQQMSKNHLCSISVPPLRQHLFSFIDWEWG